MRVLFIGNSATYMHDMPATFARLSGAETDRLVKGGCVLSRYADEADELGIRARGMIRDGYDLVFLQDNGNCISSPEMRDKCISACRELDRLIRESGARTAIYIRPPYGYTAHGHTHEEQITAFMDLFEGIASELGCDFAPAAAAYRYMEEHHPEINLYHTDNAHTSPAGALLVACLCVLAAGLPLPEEIDGGAVPQKEAQIIRNAAEAVFSVCHEHPRILIRKARAADAEALRQLYFEHLTKYLPKEEQDMTRWAALIEKFAADDNMHLLVAEVNGTVVSSVQMAIVENLTHNLRPFAVIENVVTHADHRCCGYASALLEKASEIARERGCYKISLETGSNRESTLNFYRRNGFVIDAKHACVKRL